jgi:diguanylate cyclase (GGDEF)-like protein
MDALTELANRRAFEDVIQRLTALTKKEGGELSLVFVDVDRFKPLNDGFGHQAGDFTLRLVAGLLRDAIRKGDFAARFGGDEFAVILPDTTMDEAVFMAERIRSVVRDHSTQFRDNTLSVTVSIGIAQWRADEDVQSLVDRADKALYAAKKQGRDCSCLHDNESCQVIKKPTLRLHTTEEDAGHKTA